MLVMQAAADLGVTYVSIKLDSYGGKCLAANAAPASEGKEASRNGSNGPIAYHVVSACRRNRLLVGEIALSAICDLIPEGTPYACIVLTGDHNSVFNGSVFNGSVFNGGVFNSSVFNGSVFNGSVFNSSVFNSSVFNGGVFYGSILYGSLVTGVVNGSFFLGVAVTASEERKNHNSGKCDE